MSERKYEEKLKQERDRGCSLRHVYLDSTQQYFDCNVVDKWEWKLMMGASAKRIDALFLTLVIF